MTSVPKTIKFTSLETNQKELVLKLSLPEDIVAQIEEAINVLDKGAASSSADPDSHDPSHQAAIQDIL